MTTVLLRTNPQPKNFITWSNVTLRFKPFTLSNWLLPDELTLNCLNSRNINVSKYINQRSLIVFTKTHLSQQLDGKYFSTQVILSSSNSITWSWFLTQTFFWLMMNSPLEKNACWGWITTSSWAKCNIILNFVLTGATKTFNVLT